ncbi:hypothetical protein [Natronosalvus vescus]|uniref:hypothetical protein n=1 Tax=Natronosalvus vescus TaxID=2953881 RepID=UPI0020919901|nr:hypothetical protein [Natronosalvus vescus]
MKRRNFLVGVGGTALGGSALLGTGAFSRVESTRAVNIAVATDEDAYLGLKPLDTPNSQNYVALDENGHLYVQIDGEGDQQDVGGDGPIGEGVNSNSRTWFNGMFEICNQGKDEALVYIDVGGLEFHSSSNDGINDAGEPVADVQVTNENLEIYDQSIIRDDDDGWVHGPGAVALDVGECVTASIVTSTFGIDATAGEPLVSGDAVVTAISDGAGSVPE